jgi:hypothetical protein
MSNRYIYLRIVGGLGNQLYQFSFAYYLFKKYRFNGIKVDISGISGYREVWGCMLDLALSSIKLQDFVEFGNFKVLSLRLPRILSKFPRLSSVLGLVSDSNSSLFLSKNNSSGSLFLDGYFEDLPIRVDYKNLLAPLLRNDLDIPIENNVIVVNVRGGEYARLGWSNINDREYYTNAISGLYKILPNPVFHLVTDDVAYAQNLLKGLCVFDKIHKPDPEQNFKIIYSAKYKVLSKSTFSKWAGHLSKESSNIMYHEMF